MAPHPQKLTVTRRLFPLARPILTPAGEITAAGVVVADISDGDSRGRAEGVPVPFYGETPESVGAAVEAMKAAVSGGLNRETLQQALPPGGARNALDCALWDIDAKRAWCSVADLAGLGAAAPVATARTVVLDTPARMAEQAAALKGCSLLKVMLGAEGDADRLRAVRDAVPASRLIVDAGGAWDAAAFNDLLGTLVECRVELVEQPLAPGADDALAGMACPIALCADESCRTTADLDGIAGKYTAVSIGLDKAGGLTEALALLAEARRRGLRIMSGGMIGTSLGVAPALLVAQQAEIVCLDGPLLLASDRVPGLRYEANVIQPPEAAFWG